VGSLVLLGGPHEDQFALLQKTTNMLHLHHLHDDGNFLSLVGVGGVHSKVNLQYNTILERLLVWYLARVILSN